VCVSQVTPFPGTHLWERNRDDVIEMDWDSVARHVRRPKFRSMARLQPTIALYIELMNKEMGMPMGADLLPRSRLAQFFGKRSARAFRFLTRKWADYPPLLFDALVEAREGRVDQAIARLEALHRRFPTATDPLGNLAWIHLSNGRPAEAALNFRKLLRLSPDDADAHWLLGKALAETGDRARAERQMREALRLRPDHPSAARDLESLTAKAA
jgi:tetratricopeptide (TPR) repeat protein